MPVRVPSPTAETLASTPGGPGGPIRVTAPSGTRKRKAGGGGALESLGPLGELVGDVGSAIYGVPFGVYETGKAIALDTRDLITEGDLSPERTGAIGAAIGRNYADVYGPLLHGDFSGVTSGEDLFQILLDAATIATLGGAGAARVGLAPAAARQIELRGPGALLGQEGQLVLGGRSLSRNPVIRARQELVDRALKALPPGTPLAGETARFGREARRQTGRTALGRATQAREFREAINRLSPAERDALGILARVPLPAHLAAWKRTLEETAAAGSSDAARLLRTLDDPKVRKLYEKPSEAMLRAHEEAAKLGEIHAGLLADYGAFDLQLAEQSRFRSTRLAAGARAYTPGQARQAVRRIDTQLRRLRRQEQQLQKLGVRLRGRGTPELRELRAAAGETARSAGRKTATAAKLEQAVTKAGRLEGELRQARELLERLMTGNALSADEMIAAGLRAGSDLAAVRTRLLGRQYDRVVQLADRYDRALAQLARRARLDQAIPSMGEITIRQQAELAQLARIRADIAGRLAAGRRELARLADVEETLLAERELIGPGIVGGPPVEQLRAQLEAAGRPEPIYLPDLPARRRGGRRGSRNAASLPGSPIHRSEGVLFRLGELALDPSLLSREFLRAVEFARYKDLHDLLLEAAVKVPYRRGERARLPAGHVWVRRPHERIGFLESIPGERLRELIPEPGEVGSSELAARGFVSRDAGDALVEAGFRYAVPEQLARQVSGEFRQTGKVLRLVIDRPTTVWRALVLNLRVGWLTGNLVGNTLLAALRFAGPAGWRGYLDAIRTAKGPAAVRRLLNDKAVVDALGPDDIARVFPEHTELGSFIGSQRPQLPVGRLAETRTGRTVGAVAGSLARADRGYEAMLRRGAINTALRQAPEIRARLKAMRRETRSFRDVALDELEQNPALAREISDKVNSALGDFLRQSPFERNVLRRAMPFWGWYQAIAGIVVHLALEHPGRANLLAKLGEVGTEDSEDQLGPLPSHLQGAIPLAGDRLLKTQALLPFATVPQLAAGAGAILPGGSPEALSRELNPFVQAAIASLASERSRRGLVGDVAASIGEQLPQTRLARTLLTGPPPSKLYRHPTTLQELLQFSGVPIRTLNPIRARKLAR